MGSTADVGSYRYSLPGSGPRNCSAIRCSGRYASPEPRITCKVRVGRRRRQRESRSRRGWRKDRYRILHSEDGRARCRRRKMAADTTNEGPPRRRHHRNAIVAATSPDRSVKSPHRPASSWIPRGEFGAEGTTNSGRTHCDCHVMNSMNDHDPRARRGSVRPGERRVIVQTVR